MPPAATTLAPDATPCPATNPIQPNNLQLGSAPILEVNRVSDAEAGEEIGNLRRRELLNSANNALKLAETASAAIPVIGNYFGVVAKVGLTVVEMVLVSVSELIEPVLPRLIMNVKVMDENDETAKKLGTHVCHLSDVLKRFGNKPDQHERYQTTNGMESLQQ